MKTNLSNIICAAAGAVLAYYCFYPLFYSGYISANIVMLSALLPVLPLCFFTTLSLLPFLGDFKNETSRLFKLLPLRIGAFIIGFILGLGAAVQSTGAINFGIPEDTVIGISGILQNDPSLVSGGRAMSVISLQMVTGKSGVKATANGEINVFFPEGFTERLKEFGRGTEIDAEGVLHSKESVFFNANSLHITKAASSLDRFRTGIRLGLVQKFTGLENEKPPWGWLALALLLGIRDNLETGVSAMYRNAGASHILALSGMHLAVLVGLISLLFKRVMGVKLAAITGAFIIIAYCFIVGPLPSLYRAAIMYLLGVLAVLGMLKKDVFSLLCMAFMIQIIIMPQSGKTLSFILSYLALAGILIIGGKIINLFKGKIPGFLLQPVSASLGAFIATAAITTWFFAELRPIGIIAGLFLAPLAMVFMVVSILWLCLDFILPSISSLIGNLLSMLYWLMDKTASAASLAPGIRADPFIVIAISVLLFALLFWLDRRRNKKNTYLEPLS